MTRGLNRRQIGVTEEMIETFGDAIFRMSHNHQVRDGDPYRKLDWDEIERQREQMGMSDGQIAARIGLTQNQVLYIRTVLERRRFHTGHYVRLLELGGGRRFRAERFTPHLDHFAFSDDALALRGAMSYPPELARKYVEEGWWADDTLTGWLERHVAERPLAPAIRAGEVALNYAQLGAKVANLAGALLAVGIERGDVVAVQLPNIPEFLIAYLAIARLGGVMQTIHMPYRAAECETLFNHSSAKAVICLSQARDYEAAQVMRNLQNQCPKLKHVIALGPPVPGALSLHDMIESELSEELPEPPVASDPFLLLYTSGTTAAPKGVPLSYHNILSNARLGAPEHEMGPDDVILSAAPFSHLYGAYSFHVALAVGACSLLLPVFTPPDLASAIDAGKPTGLWTAPAHVAACMNSGLFETTDLTTLKLVIMSGSACPPELVRAFQATIPNGKVTQLWGMTETQGGLYSRPSDPLEVSANSAGRPSPGTEVRIIDPELGTPCKPGAEGELQVRGPLLFPGYYRNDAASEAAFAHGGWFRSGDLAVEDEAGNVAITGRIKDVINRGGVKFNPRDVEDLLDSHPAIAQSAIVPMPDPVLGEKACAFVTLAPDVEAPTLEALAEYLLRHKIAKNKLPERLVVIDEMPLTPTRKVIKGRLQIPEA
ncbi:MAG: acyl--CoA ligase [Alphaproteobacteria bacterium]|nr:acyl--CoA ligase [Alphaproteobacteria bacterium]